MYRTGACATFPLSALEGEGMRITTILFLLALFPGIGLTAEYHVAPSGSDWRGDGSAQHPWREVQKAVDRAGAGDTIIVHGGDYRPLVIERGGTEGRPLVLRSEPAHAARILGTTGHDGRNAAIHIVADHVVVEGFDLEGERRRGIVERGIRVSGFPGDLRRGVVLRNNRVRHFASQGITTSLSPGVVIEGNEVCCTLESHGIYVANSGDRPVIRGNRIHDCHKAGIQINADRYIEGGDGVISGALIERNLLYRNVLGRDSAAINLDGVVDSLIRDNLLVDNRFQGIANFIEDGARPSRGNVYLNNTLIMPAGSHHGLKFRDGSSHGVVRNNVLIDLGAEGDGLAVDGESLPGLASDHNLITRVEDSSDRRLSLSEWQARRRQDQHSLDARRWSLRALFVNPDLEHPERGDFSPRPGGPLVDAGVMHPGLGRVDLAGRPRVQGRAVDIGAYEAGASSSSP